MRSYSSRIVALIMLFGVVSSMPMRRPDETDSAEQGVAPGGARAVPAGAGAAPGGAGAEVISVRITSSVAVDRGTRHHRTHKQPKQSGNIEDTSPRIHPADTLSLNSSTENMRDPELEGANMEFLKQLKAKKDARGLNKVERTHNLPENFDKQTNVPEDSLDRQINMPEDSVVEESVKSILEVPLSSDGDGGGGGGDGEDPEDVPRARSVAAAPPRNFIHGLRKRPLADRSQRLTTAVSFDIIHSSYKSTPNYSDHTDAEPGPSPPDSYYSEPQRLYSEAPLGFRESPKPFSDLPSASSQFTEVTSQPTEGYSDTTKIFNTPPEINCEIVKTGGEDSTISDEKPKDFSILPEVNTETPNATSPPAEVSSIIPNETPKVYSEPSKIYSEPPKVYSTPPKIYSEPPQIYSQPAKIYSEPAKIYSEPAKIYSVPSKVYSVPSKVYSEPAKIYSEPSKFYSQPASLHLPWQGQDAAASPTTTSTTEAPTTTDTGLDKEMSYEDKDVKAATDSGGSGDCAQDKCKVGYVVEGRAYRKYRVEERTADGYLVGEYGVVRHEDGALRGVRYTADSAASPRLIYDALMKFLQL